MKKLNTLKTLIILSCIIYIGELQAQRKTATARISASPKSIMDAVKSGKLSLDELKLAIAELD